MELYSSTIYLKTMSERCWPVLMAGKKHLNWSEVTPPLYVLWNHFSISTQSFSSTSGLARYIECNVKLWICKSYTFTPIYNEHPVIKSQACFVQKFLADFDPTTIIIGSIKHYIGVFPLTSAAFQVLTQDQSHHHDWRHHIPSLYKSNFGIGFNIIWIISVTGKIHLLFKIWKHVTMPMICLVNGYWISWIWKLCSY